MVKIPSIENLFKLCDYFNITLADFFSPEGTAEPLSDDLKELVNSAKNLTPEQIKAFAEAFKTIKKR